MRNRGRVLGGVVAAALLVALWHPVAEVRLITHDIGDPAPRRLQAAVDLGMVGVSVMVTWTVDRLASR